MDAMITERNLAIANEDITILTTLRPFVTPPTMTKEILVPADAVIGQYRKTLEGFKNQGFKIDSKRFKAEGHQTAFAIPCPARRTEKNWVLDPIPLIQ